VVAMQSVGQPTELLDVVADIAHRLSGRELEITGAMTKLLAEQIPELRGDQRLVELLDASVEGNIKTMIHVLENHIPIEHIQPNTAAVEYALRLAQREIPANALARAYHMGQDEFMRLVFSEIQRLDCAADLKLPAAQYISDLTYRYIDWISLYVIDVYEKERQRWISTRANLHSALIHKMTSGNPVSAGTFESETGYPLDRYHVAMVAWSAKTDDHRRLEDLIRKLTNKCGAGRPLITAVDRATAWAWIPLSKGKELDMETVCAMAAEDGCRIAAGLPAAGLAGFVRSHEQAQAAWQAALAAGERVPAAVSFGDRGVAIVSLLAKDIDATARWVTEVLGPLADDDAATALLRQTLDTYFATGENLAKTAELLHLHRNTVKYRINKVLLDNPGDRIDIALALRVCQFFGPRVLKSPRG
jgi:hypothetical protein